MGPVVGTALGISDGLLLGSIGSTVIGNGAAEGYPLGTSMGL